SVNNAAFVTQNVPSSMTVGQSSVVSVTMQNNGSTTWAAGTYSLQSQAGATWGVTRVNVSSPVGPGGSAAFAFYITAPATAGSYNFQWRMAQDGVGAFGAASTNVAITVSGGGTTYPPLSITTTSLPYGTARVQYSAQVVATGGHPGYTWSLTSG